MYVSIETKLRQRPASYKQTSNYLGLQNDCAALAPLLLLFNVAINDRGTAQIVYNGPVIAAGETLIYPVTASLDAFPISDIIVFQTKEKRCFSLTTNQTRTLDQQQKFKHRDFSVQFFFCFT